MGGGVVRPYKNEGGGGRAAHLVQLSGGCSDRAAPVGGCPRQGPAPVVSSSAAQVSPGHPSFKGARMWWLRRAALSAVGGLPPPNGAQVLAQPKGGAGAGGVLRTGAGTRCSLSPQLPQWQPPSTPRPRGLGETLRERATTFQRLRRGLANFSEFLPCASSGLRAGRAPREAEAYVMGAFGWCLRSAGAPPPLPRCGLSGSHLRSHRHVLPSATRAARLRTRRFWVAQLETRRPGAGIRLGRGGVLPGLGAGARAEIAHFSWTHTRLWTP